jgi:hypothetical protein
LIVALNTLIFGNVEAPGRIIEAGASLLLD